MKFGVLILNRRTRGSERLRGSTECHELAIRYRLCITKLFVGSLILLSGIAHAAFSVTGTVTWLEVWRIGNVAFQLSTATSSCNGYFILNASDPGFKNEYAALLAAKRTGTPVTVFSTACVAADNYSGSSYNNVDYLYPQD